MAKACLDHAARQRSETRYFEGTVEMTVSVDARTLARHTPLAGAALTQLWLFWIAPLIGGVLGGVIYRWLSAEPAGQVTGTSP